MTLREPEIILRGNGTSAATVTEQSLWDGAVTVAAYGDLMLSGEWDEVVRRGDDAVATALAKLGAVSRNDDLVFANLETTVEGQDGLIAKEPRVVGQLEVLRQSLRAVGADLVNTANNHTFDAYRSGFEAVREMLGEEGILHLGAGDDVAAAEAPLIIKRRGIRFGWLAYADRATRPSHIAGEGNPSNDTDRYGVHLLEEEKAIQQLEELRPRVDHVVVSLHWGVEYCHIPSPSQVAFARRLIDCGAALVIGHHAHVVQGVEAWGAGAIVYNLGNATTTDHFVGGRLAIRQTPRTRSSFVLRAAFDAERLRAVEMVPIRSVPGQVLVNDDIAHGILNRANRRLAAGITPRQWKSTRLYEDVLLRTLRKLDPQVIRSVGPGHFVRFGKNLLSALRGGGPA